VVAGPNSMNRFLYQQFKKRRRNIWHLNLLLYH